MNATTAIATLKALLTPGIEVMTHVSGSASKGFILAFVKDKHNPNALIPLNLLIEHSGLFEEKFFDKNGFQSTAKGTDRAFQFVYELEKRLYGGFLKSTSGDQQLRLIQKHHSLGWFLGGESPNKTWLLTTDYEGGLRKSWVVKGSYEDAKASMIEALNDLTDRHVDADNFDDFIENHTGQSEDYIYTASIEEV